MVNDQQIHEAFAADAERAKLPPGLLGRIQRELAKPAENLPWWRRLRLAHMLEVALACVVMGAMIATWAVAAPGTQHPAGGPPGQEAPTKGLSLDDVVSAYRIQRGPGGRARYADLEQSTDRRQVGRLLEAIATAEEADREGADSYNPRARQGSLHIELRSGEHIIVRPAMHCEANGEGGSTCRTLLDKQVISRGLEPDESTGTVVASPELASILLSEEWPQGIKVGLRVTERPLTERGPEAPQNRYGIVPGAVVEVMELGLTKTANEGGELTLQLPPGIYTFRVTAPGSSYVTIARLRVNENRTLLDIGFNPLQDLTTWEKGLTPPEVIIPPVP